MFDLSYNSQESKLIRITAAIILLVALNASLLAQGKRTKPGRASGRSGPQSLAEPGATSTSRLALPFKLTWQHLTEKASPITPTVDGSRIFFPLAGGEILCLDRENGALLWSSDLGGSVTSPLVVTDTSAFIAARKLNSNGSDAGGTIRALDKTTGLTIWVRDYPRSFTSPLAVGPGRIYAGSADGAFYALSDVNGEVIWKVETQDRMRGQALVGEKAVYFGSDDGALRAVDPRRGEPIWKLQTGGKIAGRPAADDRFVYVGSGDGYVYAVHAETGLTRWRSRTGAAIEAPPVLVGDRLLVASFDNFIYCLSRSTGDRIWKRRLENRIAAAPVVEGDANLVGALHSGYVAVFLNSDGRRVNLFRLEPEYEIVADPLFAGDNLILPTDRGLVVATAIRPSPNAAAQKN
jgi:outer membrane protein assembly factor BamB